MKTVKFIIFVLGLFLINYIGGIPHDSRNLFITHTIFLAPLLVEFFPLLKIQSYLKWIIKLIWSAGILALVANILGVAGIISIAPETHNVVFANNYYTVFSIEVSIQNYLLWLEIVYALVFTGTLTLSYQLREEKESIKKSKKELQEHAHTW